MPRERSRRRTRDGARAGCGCRPSPARRPGRRRGLPPAPAPAARRRGSEARNDAESDAGGGQTADHLEGLAHERALRRARWSGARPGSATRSAFWKREAHPVDPGRHRLPGASAPSQSKQWAPALGCQARCRSPSAGRRRRAPGPRWSGGIDHRDLHGVVAGQPEADAVAAVRPRLQLGRADDRPLVTQVLRHHDRRRGGRQQDATARAEIRAADRPRLVRSPSRSCRWPQSRSTPRPCRPQGPRRPGPPPRACRTSLFIGCCLRDADDLPRSARTPCRAAGRT